MYYLLNDQYMKTDLLEDFISLMWVDKFNKPGDLELVCAATPRNLSYIKPSVRVGSEDTDEVMKIETVNIKDGKMTARGRSLLSLFDKRFVLAGQEDDDRLIPSITIPNLIDDIIDNDKLIESPLSSAYIPYLSAGYITTEGDAADRVKPSGNMLTVITDLAQEGNFGVRVYVNAIGSLSGDEPELEYTVYPGADRTVNIVQNPLVMFSEEMGDLLEPEVLLSNVNYYNYCVVVASNMAGSSDAYIQQVWKDYDIFPPAIPPKSMFEGFIFEVTDITADDWDTDSDLAALLISRGEAELARRNQTKLLDAQISPTAESKYRRDYNLGDTIFVKANMLDLVKARVTEFITSIDEAGIKQYPTIELLES